MNSNRFAHVDMNLHLCYVVEDLGTRECSLRLVNLCVYNFNFNF